MIMRMRNHGMMMMMMRNIMNECIGWSVVDVFVYYGCIYFILVLICLNWREMELLIWMEFGDEFLIILYRNLFDSLFEFFLYIMLIMLMMFDYDFLIFDITHSKVHLFRFS